MERTRFTDLKLTAQLLRAVQERNYEYPTPIQAEAIPPLLEGRDLIGCAQTGTGKTAAFALPILQRLAADCKKAGPRTSRVLVLTPTRELAAQVGESFKTYGRHMGMRHALVFGGVSQTTQVKAISRGVEVLVATPGRLLDLMEQKHLNLSGIEFFVLDEADRMLDMGFMPDIRRIVAALPKKRQSLLFSATMPQEIRTLAEKLLNDPVHISVASTTSTAENIDEHIFFVDETNKKALLLNILEKPEVGRALVFTKTKFGANRLASNLGRRANAIHGNKSQTARIAALEDFRMGRCKVLVATDIAARGIDVNGITHVINYDMPNEPESYIHRIGRTARAGAAGKAISFCGSSERLLLRNIERLLKRSVPVFADHPFHSERAAKLSTESSQPYSRKKGHSGGSKFGRGRFGKRPSVWGR